MGNCQAVGEAETVVIEHPPPGKKVERILFSVTARHVMSSNPGHFVALIVSPPMMITATSASAGAHPPPTATSSAAGAPVKHLKLLRPDDVLITGQVYRLVCVEDVLKEFATKKCVKLAKLLEGGGFVIDKNKFSIRSNTDQKSERPSSTKERQPRAHRRGNSSGSSSSRAMGKNQSSGGQWRPALQSISEIGT